MSGPPIRFPMDWADTRILYFKFNTLNDARVHMVSGSRIHMISCAASVLHTVRPYGLIPDYYYSQDCQARVQLAGKRSRGMRCIRGNLSGFEKVINFRLRGQRVNFCMSEEKWNAEIQFWTTSQWHRIYWITDQLMLISNIGYLDIVEH